ncbi:MAG: hypothetical protein TR69_WS6001000406 [candidate division WS6 bacterium OLB20]|uniref:Integral membrane protein n=1 Tax=candidate division WS6 bacterium OLB20 TaxID=1617426 RepID=A0A136LXN2_9BACT|nr:MAG: hypothetical protein TR69_WS6001000406 [candidate division WS6 bacterium OLB20]
MGTDPERDFAYFEQVLAVMHGYGSDLDPAYYSVEDQLHMRDVAELTASAKLVTATSVLLICIYFVRLPSGKRLQQLRRISSVALGITIASAAAVVLLFEPLFIMFHKVFFSTNTFWQLDPATSRLIRFLPQDLFAELVLISVTLSALILCAMFVFAIILERWQKKQ